MELDLFTLTLIIGFMALAIMLNRSTMSLRDHIERVRKESDQRLDQFRTEIGGQVASIRQEMGQLRTEVGEQVASIHQEMNQFRTEMNRRFDTISHDMADLRERVTRVEETVKTREAPNRSAA